jgi:adenylate cyclase class IV
LTDRPERGALEFVEIEHKFVVSADFDLNAFREKVARHPVHKTSRVQVEDTYYLVKGQSGKVFRHRYDRELQHLSIKSLGGDNQSRMEINLDLGQHLGNQAHVVRAFLDAFGIEWSGSIKKDVEVWHLDGVEVVFYRAHSFSAALSCVEFESVHKPDMESALSMLQTWERKLGFEGLKRENRSLFEILLAQSLPEHLRYMITKG